MESTRRARATGGGGGVSARESVVWRRALPARSNIMYVTTVAVTSVLGEGGQMAVQVPKESTAENAKFLVAFVSRPTGRRRPVVTSLYRGLVPRECNPWGTSGSAATNC